MELGSTDYVMGKYDKSLPIFDKIRKLRNEANMCRPEMRISTLESTVEPLVKDEIHISGRSILALLWSFLFFSKKILYYKIPKISF